MAYCTNCGKELREGENFCTSCGAPVNNANDIAAVSEQREENIVAPIKNEDFTKQAATSPSKKKYIIGGVLLLLIFGVFIYVANLPKETADVSVQRLCKAILQNDEKSAKELRKDGDTRLEEAQNKIRSVMIEKMSIGSFNFFSEDQLGRLADAVILKVFRNNTYEYRLVKEEGKKATVEISFNTYNFSSSYISNALVGKLKNKNPNDGNPADMVIDALTEVVAEMPVNSREWINVECIYDKEKAMWAPTDIRDLFDRLEKRILTQN